MKRNKFYMTYMTYFLILLLWIPAYAGMTEKKLLCYSKAVHFQTVPHDKESTVTLEARRVASVNSDTFTYNLGKETITIISDSFASRKFLSDVKNGRCSARETVNLIPERKSPFNTK
jgi:hypothetical protein